MRATSLFQPLLQYRVTPASMTIPYRITLAVCRIGLVSYKSIQILLKQMIGNNEISPPLSLSLTFTLSLSLFHSLSLLSSTPSRCLDQRNVNVIQVNASFTGSSTRTLCLLPVAYARVWVGFGPENPINYQRYLMEEDHVITFCVRTRRKRNARKACQSAHKTVHFLTIAERSVLI